MIIRLSTKLSKKIKTSPSTSVDLSRNPFADWSAHLFTFDRTQYILACNTVSLYSVLCYGRGITDDNTFLMRMTSLIGEVLKDDGLEFFWERWILPETGTVTFSKALNRSVTGSMNDQVFLAKALLDDGEMSPYEASFKLNQNLLSYLDYKRPREAFQSMSASMENRS